MLAEPAAPDPRAEDREPAPSGELAIPIIEAVSCDVGQELAAVIGPNRGAIPGMDDDVVVEVPATADTGGVRSPQMGRLPEVITAMLRLQGSNQKLLVEAFAERSRRRLLEALLLDPTVHSYRNAVALIDEMCDLQKDVMPELKW